MIARVAPKWRCPVHKELLSIYSFHCFQDNQIERMDLKTPNHGVPNAHMKLVVILINRYEIDVSSAEFGNQTPTYTVPIDNSPREP